MLQGFYITAIDYLVDKTKFAENFGGTNKLDYSMMSGWMNPNLKGWTVFEKYMTTISKYLRENLT